MKGNPIIKNTGNNMCSDDVELKRTMKVKGKKQTNKLKVDSFIDPLTRRSTAIDDKTSSPQSIVPAGTNQTISPHMQKKWNKKQCKQEIDEDSEMRINQGKTVIAHMNNSNLNETSYEGKQLFQNQDAELEKCGSNTDDQIDESKEEEDQEKVPFVPNTFSRSQSEYLVVSRPLLTKSASSAKIPVKNRRNSLPARTKRRPSFCLKEEFAGLKIDLNQAMIEPDILSVGKHFEHTRDTPNNSMERRVRHERRNSTSTITTSFDKVVKGLSRSKSHSNKLQVPKVNTLNEEQYVEVMEEDDSSSDVSGADEEQTVSAYEITPSGNLKIDGFEISSMGLKRTPSSQNMVPGQISKGLIKLSILGKGSSGVVHKMLHVPTLQLVAVKSIPCFESDKRHQMLHELKSLHTNFRPIYAQTKSKNNDMLCPFIVTFHDAFICAQGANISLIEEYMDGGSLQNYVDQGGCKSEEVLKNVAFHVLKGIQYIHSRNQIHRDIKPSNILMNRAGDVKISDFGIVLQLNKNEKWSNNFVGTLSYMSPERILGESYTFSADIWSFGLSLMTIAMGTCPVSSNNGYWGLINRIGEQEPPKIPQDAGFSPQFCDFISKCLTKDKMLRSSPEDLLDHPFMKNFDPKLHRSQLTNTMDERKLTELDDIVEKTIDWQLNSMTKKSIYESDAHIPMVRKVTPMTFEKYNTLAKQLYLPVEVVQATFERTINKVNGQQYSTLIKQPGSPLSKPSNNCQTANIA